MVLKGNSLPIDPTIEAPFFHLLVDGLNVVRKLRNNNIIRLRLLLGDFLRVRADVVCFQSVHVRLDVCMLE